jgi:hypothetical protein
MRLFGTFFGKMQFFTAKICVFREKAVPLHPKSKNNAAKLQWACKMSAKIQQFFETTKQKNQIL